MTQYIDKDTLVAEIESKFQKYWKRGEESDTLQDGNSKYWGGVLSCLNEVKALIDTFEVKEVDLEKEIDKIDDAIPGKREDIEYIAKHFFKLGLNTKQTSEDIKIGETKIYLDDYGGEPPYDGKQWLDLSCTEYEIPSDKFKDGDNVEIIIRKTQKVE